MDQRERVGDLEEILRSAMDNVRVTSWNALPAKITAVDLERMTVEAKPLIMSQVRGLDGVYRPASMPLLVDVPIWFPGGANWLLTMPVSVGDEALIVFADRCIDGWWTTGKESPQAEPRAHSLSDGFALVGLRSLPRVVPDINPTEPELRNVEGTSRLTMTATGVAITGNLTVTGTIQGNTAILPVGLTTHTHISAAPGNPTSTGSG